MRKILRLRSILSVAVLATLVGAQAQQNVGINVTGAAPNASALLDLDVSGITGQKRGLLIPRVLRADRLAIVAPPTGLWVYQTDDVTAPVFDPGQEHGYWYYDGSQWIRWGTSIGSWSLNGNAGTNPGAALPNYLGTRNATSLNVRTINPLTTDPQMVVVGPAGVNNGFVGLNIAAPTERLDVNGAMRIFTPAGPGSGSANNLAGTIRFHDGTAAPNRWHYGKIPSALVTANTTNASTTVTITTGSTTSLAVGMAVSGPGIPVGATVATIVNGTTFTISAAATATATGVNLDFSNANGWQRLENAEELVNSPAGYTRDSLGCSVVGEMVTSPINGAPGVDQGTAVQTGNVNTPFPTNVGTANSVAPGIPASTNPNYRFARTQYIYPASELAAMGLCPGNITEIAFYALQNDVNLPAVNVTLNCNTTNGSATITTASTSGLYAGVSVSGTGIQAGTTILSVVNGTTLTLSLNATATGANVPLTFTAGITQANINYEIRIGHTALNTFVGAQWDGSPGYAGIQNSAVVSTGTTVVLGGWTPFTFSTPFNWNGVQNILIDVYWQRATPIGVSPAVQLVTGLPYQATRQGLPTVPLIGGAGVASQVPALDDNNACAPCTAAGSVPVSLYMTNVNSRPVTRIKGNVKTPFPANVPNANLIRYTGGLMLGDAAWASAAGNYKGPGTIHAKNGVYDGNSLLNDHVFDKYFDGRVRPEDAEAARKYQYVALPELKDYLATERHLPNLPSRSEWETEGMPSLGELQNGLWQQVETQALYITELERDLFALEAMAFGEDLDAATVAGLEADIQRSPRLTEQQKLHLIEALRSKADNQ